MVEAAFFVVDARFCGGCAVGSALLVCDAHEAKKRASTARGATNLQDTMPLVYPLACYLSGAPPHGAVRRVSRPWRGRNRIVRTLAAGRMVKSHGAVFTQRRVQQLPSLAARFRSI